MWSCRSGCDHFADCALLGRPAPPGVVFLAGFTLLLTELAVRDLRCIETAMLTLPAGGAWISGDNGAGKTSLLEAVCLLGYGRSFRGRPSDGLIRQGAAALQVVAHWIDRSGRSRVSGLEHAGESWTAKLDGVAVSSLSELAAPFPVLAFHPESSRVVTGPAEERRRALDWVAFHVEHRFGDLSRRYARALRQRNALLRQQARDDEFEPWEAELDQSAEQLSNARESAVGVLLPQLMKAWARLAPDAAGEAPGLALRPGWRRDSTRLGDLLLLNRARDRDLGYTTVGPHRADLDLGGAFGVASGQWSRGQAKLLALALLMAQAEALAQWTGERSVLLFDDLRAELDATHHQRVLEWIAGSGCQALVSGTEVEAGARHAAPGMALFHVEHGRVVER